MYNTNNNELEMLPCGMPDVTLTECDRVLFIIICTY